MLELKVTNQDIKLIQVTPYGAPLVSGSAGEYECRFEFDETWQGFEKTAVFNVLDSGAQCENANIGDARILVDDKCIIPASILIPNAKIQIGVLGTKDAIVRPTIYTSPMLVRKGASVGNVPEIDNTLYLQLIELIEKVGIPKGGTTSQVLAKKSDNDYDAEWIEQTGGSAKVLIVHSEDKLVADKNAVEINNAANNGYEVILELQKKYRYNLYYHDEKTGVFISVAEDRSNKVTYISQYEVDASGNIKKIVDNIPMIASTMPANVPAGLPKETQKTVQGVVDALMTDKRPADFIVRTNYQDVPNHSSQEIYEAYKAGRTVKLIRYGEEYNLTNSIPAQSNFKAVNFSKEQIGSIIAIIKDKTLTVNVTQFTPPASSVTAVVPDTLSPETNGEVQDILYALAVETDNNKQNIDKKQSKPLVVTPGENGSYTPTFDKCIEAFDAGITVLFNATRHHGPQDVPMVSHGRKQAYFVKYDYRTGSYAGMYNEELAQINSDGTYTYHKTELAPLATNVTANVPPSLPEGTKPNIQAVIDALAKEVVSLKTKLK